MDEVASSYLPERSFVKSRPSDLICVYRSVEAMFPGKAHGSPDVPGSLVGVDETSGHEVALRLQRAILPTHRQRFSLGRYDLSVRYQPAESGNRVGGDR